MRNIRSEHTANVQMSMATAKTSNATIGKHFYAPAVKREQKPTKQRGFSFRSLFKSGKIGF